MAIQVEIRFDNSFRTSLGLENTFAYFSDFEQAIPTNFPGVEKFEKRDTNTYQWTFSSVKYSGYEIQMTFATRFAVNRPTSIDIFPVPKKDQSSLTGKWTFRTEGNDTIVTFNAALMTELPVPSILKGFAAPIAKKEIGKIFARYLVNVEKALS